MMDLFTAELPPNDEPLDDTAIVSMILYFSEEESAEFKQLCRVGMAGKYADKNKANASDFLLNVLRTLYGKTNA